MAMYDIDIGIPAPLKGKDAPSLIPIIVRYDKVALSEDEVNRLQGAVRELQKQIGKPVRLRRMETQP
jgi:hypothetical protein